MISTPCKLRSAVQPSGIGGLYGGQRLKSIVLLRMIAGGPRCWSQVYLADIPEWEGDSPHDELPGSYVLKLYIPSELDSLEDLETCGFDHLGYEPHESQQRMVEQESKAYSALVGCAVTPKWYGTYEFTLPSEEKCTGIVLEYIDGQPLSYKYIFDSHGCQLPFEERAVASAEVLQHIHSYGVSHGDIIESNFLMVRDPQGRFTLRVIDFSAGRVRPRNQIANDEGRFRSDSRYLLALVLDYFDLSLVKAVPLLRAIPRQGAILKFLEVWEIQPTLEAQFEFAVANATRRGDFLTEEKAREVLRKYVT